jgi:hypothetical protein
MRERWDSRRSLEHHHITLRTGYLGVNDSRAAMSCKVMIPWGYIYFRPRIMDGMIRRCLLFLPQDRDTSCLIPALWCERDRSQLTVDAMKLFRRQTWGL